MARLGADGGARAQAAQVRRLSAEAAEATPVGLYVHVPFCEAKCSYCHFAIDPRRPDAARAERYFRALDAELATLPCRSADTLYFGGGTPSLVGAERIAGVIAAVRRHVPLTAGAEISVECNPRDLDAAGFRMLRDSGVTRLSLGAQSFDDAVLREMGRLHSAHDTRQAAAWARAAGFSNLSLDLILGWPGETRERWRRSLNELAALRPEHVSLYVLELEGRTLLHHQLRQGRLALPEDDRVADLYRDTVHELGALGLERYEISNFARAGFESRHNGKYWDDAPFFGLGLSAHSYLDGRRWWNHDRYGSYCQAIERGGGTAAVAGSRVLTPRERAGEAAFTGLRRREGLDLAAFRERYGIDLLEAYRDGLAAPLDGGLLRLDDARLRLTERGVLLSNEVFQAFV